MFEVREFIKDDYVDFGKWLEMRGRMVPKLEYLSKNGVVVEHENEKIAIGFLFSFDKISAIANLSSNPDSDLRSEGVDFMIGALLKKAKDMGHTMVIANTNLDKLIDRLSGFGFEVLDKNLVQMGLEL